MRGERMEAPAGELEMEQTCWRADWWASGPEETEGIPPCVGRGWRHLPVHQRWRAGQENGEHTRGVWEGKGAPAGEEGVVTSVKRRQSAKKEAWTSERLVEGSVSS